MRMCADLFDIRICIGLTCVLLVFFFSQVQAEVIDYQFDEPSWAGATGEVRDSSGNTYHATAVNGPTTAAISPAIPGEPGTCSYGVFDGENDYVALPSTYPDITKSYTITAWIRTRDNSRSGQRILIDDPNNSQGFGFSLGDGGTGRVRFYSRSTTPIILDTPSVINNDIWYFVAAVADLDSKTKRIYVFDQSGSKIADNSNIYTGEWGFDNGAASIGGENDVSGERSRNFHFAGNLDEIRIHEGALTEAAIQGHQNRSRFCFNQSAEYRFDLCSETDTVVDDSGNGFDGTVINGPLAIQEGKICNGAYFDGIDDYVRVDDSDLFDNTSKLTIAGWINPENIGVPPAGTNARGIISKRNNASSNVSYGIFFYSSRGDGKLYVDLDTVNNRFSSNAVIPENMWTHFAVVFDGTLPVNERARLYLNGNLDTTARENSTTIPDYNSDLYIGNLYFGSSELKVYQGLLDELRIIPEALSIAEVRALYNDTRSGCQICNATIDHYRLIHDGFGLICAPENIQIRACLDADCTAELTGNIDISLSPAGWVGGTTQTITSGATLQLHHTTAGVAVLQADGIGAAFVADNSPRCFIGADEQADCDLLFGDAGFVFDVPNHVSDELQIINIAALGKDPDSTECIPSFQNVTKELQFQSTYTNPATGGLAVHVDGSAINASSPGTSLNVNFDANGNSSVTLQYGDVGQLNLTIVYQGSGDDVGLVLNGVDSFITRPDDFSIIIADNPAAGDADGAVFKKAGETFPIEISAINSSGDTTPNYGQESPAESVKLLNNLLDPAGQHNPLILGSFNAFGTNCSGASASGTACGQFRWDEVGIIEIIPSVADDDYLGAGNVIGAGSGHLGRFIPDHFDVITNGPEFGSSCGIFSYLGQPFHYLTEPVLTVIARNTGGDTTLNYAGNFWKLTNAGLTGKSYSAATGTLDLGLVPAVDPVIAETGAGAGTLTFSSGGGIAFMRNAVVAPFEAEIQLQVNVTDSDGVIYPANPAYFGQTLPGQGIAFSNGKNMRYGRLTLENAHGSELLPLSVPLRAEYYDGTGFVPNEDDNCTPYTATQLLLADHTGNLSAGDTTASGLGTLFNGGGDALELSAPGEGNDGSAQLEYNLGSIGANLPWLLFDWNGDGFADNNPISKATFGIFKGDPRLIYMRESVW